MHCTGCCQYIQVSVESAIEGVKEFGKGRGDFQSRIVRACASFGHWST
jgi:hypothetical protein